jgi:hypothetical protein
MINQHKAENKHLQAIYSPETSADFHRNTWHYIPDDNYRCENLKFNNLNFGS